ncbi:LITAF-like zinc ribbon domain protein (macronuclear) [Tetrahymena thermophila SB210]|uniref:LITAF-like zinc ribbon domain protein n=1 Tax=Tetrahymena thermophila (strain SB210) TaxID=312017 RepID=Q23YW0_TETTS|nr:LITAF-like zinc ribbon domain protein [Tetrahymena thermophila SB210]EAS01695.3 LITAF-like zinc ribbon domain protein [Tetrahymena thermophila SB210]|eukprot:XP_001021940.3 LITAF-like zinc ribbon domain protein [Tetrahymena thermophila SB210]
MYQNQAQYPPNYAQPPMAQQPMNMQMQPVQNMTNSTPFPVQATCPSCQKTQTTVVETKAGSGTWKMCCILFCFTGCCCIPFCMDSCKDKIHHCSNCQTEIGKFEYKVC